MHHSSVLYVSVIFFAAVLPSVKTRILPVRVRYLSMALWQPTCVMGSNSVDAEDDLRHGDGEGGDRDEVTERMVVAVMVLALAA